MNYTFLVVIAACLIGCGAQPYTQFQLNRYCKECMKDSSVGSVWRHPFRCDAFINCQILTNGFIAHEQPCPLGFYFDDNSLNCIRNHACRRPCGQGQKYMHFAFCDMFFECKNGLFGSKAVYTRCRNNYYFDQSKQACTKVKPDNCPVHCPHFKASSISTQYIVTDSYGKNSIVNCRHGEEFNLDHCGCVKPHVCADDYALSKIQGNFRQRTHGSRWVEMPCPPNLAFNMTTCVCSDFINPHPVKGCFKISIPLKYNTEDIYKSYVQNMRVTIVKKSGKFDGGYLVLPVTANNEFRNGIEVSLSFLLSDKQKGNTVSLIGNGRCHFSPTFAIYIKDAQGRRPKLVVDMMVSARKTKVTLETNVSFNQWYNVKVVKTAGSAILYIDGTRVKYENVSGYVRKSYCSYGVGNMNKMSNFNGYMKDIYLSKCI